MIPIRFREQLNPELREFAQDFVQTVLKACDPAILIRDQFAFDQFSSKTHVLAFGKASAAMATECVSQLGSRFAGGVVLAPEETIPVQHHELLRFLAADHPIPTQQNIDATLQLVQYARSISSEDHCIVCISGGGSAHLCSPAVGVTLEQIVSMTKVLNAQGVAIDTLNRSRKSMETLKSGGLARELNHVELCEAVVLSDVLGNDFSTIASGPMWDKTINVPHCLIGDHHTPLSAAAKYIDSRFENHPIAHDMIQGAATLEGQRLASRYLEQNGITPHLIAGETTVEAQSSSGVGGPTLELVLSTAVELARSTIDIQDWIVMGFATDGIDGPSGAAGALVSSEMLTDSDSLEAAADALQRHDTLPFLESISATIWTGPTGTNVNDVCLVCRDPRK